MGATWTFTAHPSAYSTSTPLGDKIPFEATFKVSGKPNLGVTASTGLSDMVFIDGNTLAPTFSQTKYAYAYSGTANTSISTYPVYTTAHTVYLYIDDVYQETLTSGTTSTAVAITAGTGQEYALYAFETGKTPKIYKTLVVRSS